MSYHSDNKPREVVPPPTTLFDLALTDVELVLANLQLRVRRLRQEFNDIRAPILEEIAKAERGEF